MKFEWDENKNKENIKKHKVGFYEASTIFAGRYIEIPDVDHSINEERFVALGISFLSRELFVCYCYRVNVNGEIVIRIYSARKANKNEKEEFFNER